MSNPLPAEFSEQIEALTATTRQVSDISGNLTGSAGTAFTTAETLAHKIEALSLSMRQSMAAVEGLMRESAKIGQVIQFLEGVIESTHVLAINASIVAARAGRNGDAFAVVSKELRQLAGLSSESLAGVGRVVQDVQGRIQALADGMQVSGSAILEQQAELQDVVGHLQGTLLGVEVIHSVSENLQAAVAQLAASAQPHHDVA